LSKGGKIAVRSQAYFLRRRKEGCKTVMQSEDYSRELEGNYARHDNKKGKYREELCYHVDEPKVPGKRPKSKQAKDRQFFCSLT